MSFCYNVHVWKLSDKHVVCIYMHEIGIDEKGILVIT